MSIQGLTMTRPNLTGLRCEALFVSGLQRSAAPTPGMVAEAISGAVQRFGVCGCAGRMAEEFGDHPETAAARMRWVRQILAQSAAAQAAGRLAETAPGIAASAATRASIPFAG